ncbi:UNVERIFIED_CONTAM: hypothetical protein FKN15_033480, partial [Acipenser sinensis]
DAQPTDCERDVWNQVNAVLQDSESILLGLQAYKGAGQEIREMRNPAIQNDFSYYRRTISRNRINNMNMKGCIKVLKEQPADNVEGLVNALK